MRVTPRNLPLHRNGDADEPVAVPVLSFCGFEEPGQIESALRIGFGCEFLLQFLEAGHAIGWLGAVGHGVSFILLCLFQRARHRVERPFQAAMPALWRVLDGKTTPARKPSLPAESPLHTSTTKVARRMIKSVV